MVVAESSNAALTPLQRRLINEWQSGFPLEEEPFKAIAEELGTDEASVLAAADDLLTSGTLSRLGPLFQTEALGGALSLAAMAVPDEELPRVCEIVNGMSEVAHNYLRDHEMNLWFVVAAESDDKLAHVVDEIQWRTGYTVYNLPKEEEFYVGLQLRI